MSSSQQYEQDDQTIARQLGFLLAKGMDRDAALTKLRAAAPPQLQHSIETLVSRLEPSERDPHLSARFIRRAAALGAEPGHALASMSAMSAEARTLADNLYQSIKPGLLYIAVVAFLGFSVSVLWLTMVWPQFANLFANFHTAMPATTVFILNLGFFGFPLAFLTLFLFGILLWAMTHLRSRQLRRLEPMRLRLFDHKLVQSGNTWLTLGLCEAFLKAGVPADAALTEAKKLLGTDIGQTVGRDLALAQQTDTSADELRFQVSDSSLATVALARVSGQRGLWVLRVILYLLVATAIIFFYEPIFFLPRVNITN